MPNDVTHFSRSTDETRDVARRIGEQLKPGAVLALVGPLGAGKTQFVKGLALGLGVPADQLVSSPTFTLCHEYVGRLTLYHLDAYRLSRPAAELAAIGFDELIDSGGVVVVEWADRAAALLPPQTVWVRIEPTGAEERRIVVSPQPPAG